MTQSETTGRALSETERWSARHCGDRVVGGALAGPLILWIPAVTAALAAATETAAAAVSLGALLGGAAAGGAAGKVANKTLNKGGKNYGVNE